ncbi:efflux RND transporter periplasmic adaptor subunit [bacterium]|nr:efflux RND transporter periplasmic adaptor subunit [bacterium]
MKDKFVAIGVVLAALFLAVMMNVLQPDAEKTSEPEAAIAVKTEIVNRAQLAMHVESQGIVAPRTRTRIISEVSGLVLDVADAFVVGGTFKTGDMLLKLDPTDYEVALQRAEAKVISFKALMELENARSVQAEKEWGMTGRPKSEAPLLALRRPYLLEAEANLLQAKAEVRQAEIKLSKTIIRASYAGMVSKKSADIGQFVTTGTAIGETFAIDFVEIRLPLSEKDLTMMDGLSSQVELRKKEITLSGTVDGIVTSWQATLARSEGVVDELNRSQYIVARVADPYGLGDSERIVPLRVGTFVKASIEGKVLNDVFKVPRSALLEGSRIGLVDDQALLKIIPVEVASTDDNHYYISGGLQDGYEIVTSALGTPIEGLKLRIKNDPSPALLNGLAQ